MSTGGGLWRALCLGVANALRGLGTAVTRIRLMSVPSFVNFAGRKIASVSYL